MKRTLLLLFCFAYMTTGFPMYSMKDPSIVENRNAGAAITTKDISKFVTKAKEPCICEKIFFFLH